jgi:hypothetical protein
MMKLEQKEKIEKKKADQDMKATLKEKPLSRTEFGSRYPQAARSGN